MDQLFPRFAGYLNGLFYLRFTGLMKMGKNMLMVVGNDTLLGVTSLYLLTANDNRDFNFLAFQFIERGFQFFPLRRAWSVGLNRIIFRFRER